MKIVDSKTIWEWHMDPISQRVRGQRVREKGQKCESAWATK